MSGCIGITGQSKTVWKKYEGNPIIGGNKGLFFDVCALLENDTTKMWVSWRDSSGIGYTTSLMDSISFLLHVS